MTVQDETICGIIMPISAIEPEYTAEHWTRVRNVIAEAISAAGLTPQPVWENQSNDVIQARILKNIYENDVVVCDVSGKNANVMLELGMRLTTKKPTILIADEKTKLPFDTSMIAHNFYNSDLEYNCTAKFIRDLSEVIKSAFDASKAGTFKTFVEHFHFETVTPGTVSVPAEKFFAEQLDKLTASVSRIEDRLPLNMGVPMPVTRNVFGGGGKSGAAAGLLSKIEEQLGDLPSIADALSPGDMVEHGKFGLGVVVGLEGDRVEIDFRNAGRRHIRSAFIKKVSDEGRFLQS